MSEIVRGAKNHLEHIVRGDMIIPIFYSFLRKSRKATVIMPQSIIVAPISTANAAPDGNNGINVSPSLNQAKDSADNEKDCVHTEDASYNLCRILDCRSVVCIVCR